jgi:hypothetical protein
MNNGSWAVQRLVFLLVALSALLLPTSSAQEPPSESSCLAYAFTISENHHFLVADNSSLFGGNLTVIHNCDYATLFVDGEFVAGSNNSFKTQIELGFHNITIGLDEGVELNFNMVNFYPDRLNWEFEWLDIQESKPTFIEAGSVDVQINYAVAFSIVIVWVLSTYVYWQLINNYTQRNFIEEVVK